MTVCPYCRDRAEGVKDQANSTRQALDVSEKAIKKAVEALNEAQANLNRTRNATTQVDPTHLASSEELFSRTSSLSHRWTSG